MMKHSPYKTGKFCDHIASKSPFLCLAEVRIFFLNRLPKNEHFNAEKATKPHESVLFLYSAPFFLDFAQ